VSWQSRLWSAFHYQQQIEAEYIATTEAWKKCHGWKTSCKSWDISKRSTIYVFWQPKCYSSCQKFKPSFSNQAHWGAVTIGFEKWQVPSCCNLKKIHTDQNSMDILTKVIPKEKCKCAMR
jgi:hypothetical protein